MIPIPKPKFLEQTVGQSEDDYFDEIFERQAHVLGDAIDRVSFFLITLTLPTGCREPMFDRTSSDCTGSQTPRLYFFVAQMSLPHISKIYLIN